MRASSSVDGGEVLIAAVSGRALAAAARRGGYRPLVADLFGDLDTQATAAAFDLIPGGLGRGMEDGNVMTALERLAGRRSPLGLVCGSGFEGRPELLARLARRWPLVGNRPEVVARIKDPVAFAGLCARLGLPHPDVSLARPDNPSRWLAKRVGAAGGWHVRPAEEAEDGDGWYYQQRVEGDCLSALFLADGRRARTVGFSRQWTDPAAGAPFRYGGAVRLPGLAAALQQTLAAAAAAVAAAAGLVGLNSADFIVAPDRWWLIEVNPRPGATLDIFADRDGRLFAAHVKACAGEIDAEPLAYRGSAASAIVYATREVPSVAAIEWPAWAADRQRAGTSVKAGGPLCTVLAEAPDADGAVELVRQRAAAVRQALEDNAT